MIRYNNLRFALKQFRTLRTLTPQVKAWVESSAFKTQYIDANHPYPPLLNPATIDYESIPADLAWEWNLPLPPRYDIINISNGLSASAATLYFFKECNINVPNGNFKAMYSQLLRQNSSQKTAIFFYFTAFCCDKSNAMHFKYMLHKKVPLLYIARDPISKIKSLLNHITYRAPHCTRFNLTCNPHNLIPQETYMWSGDIKPSLKILQNPTQFELEWLYATIACDSILEIFKQNISTIHCIDFNDLNSQKCGDTFRKLAKKLGFEAPKNLDIFSNRIWNEVYYLLPTTLYVYPSDMEAIEQNLDSLQKEGGFEIVITLHSHLSKQQKDFVDISNEIEQNLIIDGAQILVIIQKDMLFKLQENKPLYNKIIDFLRDYIKAIKNEVKRRKDVIFVEGQVLECLSQNNEMRKKIKQIFDNELNFLKANHPDIVASWRYYNEFEKMCNELDLA